MQRLDRFMARANARYYASRDPFADFTTAPEISQIFGELLGAWAVVVWQRMGRPDPVILAEAGPGRGTLMRDALRLAARVAPDFAGVIRLHLVETSGRLRAIQKDALEPFAVPCTWHDGFETIPPGPMILLANEFLDALPIRQFRRTDGGRPASGPACWEELHVDHDRPAWLPSGPPAGPAGARKVPPGGVIEVGEAALGFVAWLAARLPAQGGCALLIDYGPAEPGHGDTLQALRDRAPGDPFAEAGFADLTAHVDFPALADAAAGLQVAGPIPQGHFLAALGLFARTGQLARAQPEGEGGALVEAAHRLADPARMGLLFKAMAFCHPDLGLIPGFEEIEA